MDPKTLVEFLKCYTGCVYHILINTKGTIILIEIEQDGAIIAKQEYTVCGNFSRPRRL